MMVLKAEELAGRTIGNYLLLKMLGTDSMSAVFLAQNQDDPQERVALKVLTPAEFSTPQEEASFHERFLQQALATQKMHHEHIWPLWDYGATDHIFYMVMPLLTGSTLAEKLANEPELMPLEEVARYLNQLASAIDYAHQQGIVHGDIKPGNVLIDEEGNAYLVDFGIVHLFDNMPNSLPANSGNPIAPGSPNASNQVPANMTGNETIYGTPAYMAPEIFKGEQIRPAADIYSLGVLLYQLVTGKLPFTADTTNLVSTQQPYQMPPSPRSLRPDLPEPAEAVMLKALAMQPADRFASASALATAFDAGIKAQWVEGLQPVPLIVPLVAGNTQAEEPTVPDVVPVPENPDQTNPLVLSPALASTLADIPLADQPTQANPLPVVPPPASPQNFPLVLLWGAVVLAAVVLLALILLTSPVLSSSSNSNTPSTPTTTSPSTSGGSGGSGALTPTTQPAGGSAPSAGATPASTPLPASTPGTTSPAAPGVPGGSPVPIPGNTPPTTNPGITPLPTTPPPPVNPQPTTAPPTPAPPAPPAPAMPTPTP
jgi:serine/threonine protein kinase